MRFGDWLIKRITRRPPDFQIGGAADPYMNRWWVIPRNRFFNIYLHQFIRDDEDRAHHDHPWPSLSWSLRGTLLEYTKKFARVIPEGSWTFRGPWFSHRLALPLGDSGKTWTLFITGPRIREWGFHCPRGWVHWKDFTAGESGAIVGKGCE